ncbi:site-specific DNA-methyltransferase [Phycisphaeraceae bacterium D3-23]
MARKKSTQKKTTRKKSATKSASGAGTVTHSRHKSTTRKNNPPAALAGEAPVPPAPKAVYDYSPRLNPVLRSDPQGEYTALLDAATKRTLTKDEAATLEAALASRAPWLEWANKRETDTRDLRVDPVALHIHERISAQAILKTAAKDVQDSNFRGLFGDPQQAYHEAVQFYKHDIDWTNRLILGDSLSVMSSLARRESLSGGVQMIYMDPPYGIKFASNFQPQVGQRDVKDKDTDLTREPEMVRAYRDTWHLGIHSYLAYLRDRLIVARELLADSGSIFVQISDENLHRVRQVMDEVFGAENFCSVITFAKTSGFSPTLLSNVSDYLIWYAKDKEHVRYRQLSIEKTLGEAGATQYTYAEDQKSSAIRNFQSLEDLNENEKVFAHGDLSAQGTSGNTSDFELAGVDFSPPKNSHWKTTENGIRRLIESCRAVMIGKSARYKRYLDDFPIYPISNIWTDTNVSGFADKKQFVVQTNVGVVARCMLMTTDPGDLVLDPTCGSGTTAYVAEQWGRRWITTDTSRVALALARQRLLTAKFDRYLLEDETKDEAATKNGKGIDPATNFQYKTVPHITLGSIARNENLDPIFAEHEPILDEKLAAVNVALKDVDDTLREKLVTKLAEKMQDEGLRAATDADRRRWLLPGTPRKVIETAYAGKKKLKVKHVKDAFAQVPPDGKFEHWHVPFDTDDDWPEALSKAVNDYRKAWRAKMDAVNACIDANAEQETLVDQPVKVPGVVRVTGPFTVEAVQPPEMSLSDEAVRSDDPEFAATPGDLETFHADGEPVRESREVQPRPELDVQNVDAYLDTMIQLLRADGVKFPNNKTMRFTRLERRSDINGLGVHAEGRWEAIDGEADNDPEGEATVAVVIGPQYGSVTSGQVIDAMRWALRQGYTDIVFAGFSFDATAQAEIEHYKDGKMRMHLAHIRPDVNPAMDGLLKNPAKPGEGQLFAVFGQPRVEVHDPDEDGLVRVEMEGVDIYDPVKNVTLSTKADKVACWLLDGDYDGQTFCVTQAFFPDKSAWGKLAKALGGKDGTIDDDAFEALSGTVSLPFAIGEHKRAAVKVIDPRGNEVMKVVAIGG